MAGIEIRIIMELMGRPPEHLTESLNTLVVKMGSEEGVEILDKKYHNPEPVKDTKDIYSAFAEIELQIDSIEKLLTIIFIYSPSNLEIISPEKLKISNDDLNAFFNSLLGRIHHHSSALKQASSDREILIKQILYLKEKMPEVEKHIKINLAPQNQQSSDQQPPKQTPKKKAVKKPIKKSTKKPAKKTKKKQA